MAEATFDIITENHRAHVGADTYEFPPEVETHVVLSAWAALMRKHRERTDAHKAAGEIKTVPTDEVDSTSNITTIEIMAADAIEATADLRVFISDRMIAESADLFASKSYMDKTLIALQNFILEVYGLRPTGPSSDSLESSAAPMPGSGSGSTETSPSAA